MGGENQDENIINLSKQGSSPRGRGKRFLAWFRRALLGLIPAWAGKTIWDEVCTLTGGAHPRVGGENCAASYRQWLAVGSSPRGRGKLRIWRR